ncbi:hypothetical protein M885DRAFT_589674 [Pelagophyceae sp. CCMP2097]|nr:hypothetical protein M885DRAFT_589674 [Pelagophyceae sp. CCMP2097]
MDLALPLKLRRQKWDSLSGEAIGVYRRLANGEGEARHWRDAVRRCEGLSASRLARAMRRLDLDGYGAPRRREFGAALADAGADLDATAVSRLFNLLDVGKRGRADAEVMVELVRHWRDEVDDDDRGSGRGRDAGYDPDVSDLLENVRLRSGALKAACERLDAGRGALRERDLALALTHAGVPLCSRATLARVVETDARGYVAYPVLLAAARSQDEEPETTLRASRSGPSFKASASWRSAAAAWRRARGAFADSDGLLSLRDLRIALNAAGAQLAQADLEMLWRGVASDDAARTDVEQVDELFYDEEFDDADSSDGDAAAAPALLKPWATEVDFDEPVTPVSPPEPPQWYDHWARCPREAVETEPPPPAPFWLETQEAPARRETERYTPRPAPYHRSDQRDDDEGPQRHPDAPPGPVVLLRSQAALRQGEAFKCVKSLCHNDDIGRATLQAIANHLGVPVTRAEIEDLMRWIDRGGLHCGPDLDGRAPSIDSRLRCLLGLPARQHALRADGDGDDDGGGGGDPRASSRAHVPPLAADATLSAHRRACYRVMRRANLVARRCVAADCDGSGFVSAPALDAALRDGSILPESDERADVVAALTRPDGRVKYAAVYATLQHRLDRLGDAGKENAPAPPDDDDAPPDADDARPRTRVAGKKSLRATLADFDAPAPRLAAPAPTAQSFYVGGEEPRRWASPSRTNIESEGEGPRQLSPSRKNVESARRDAPPRHRSPPRKNVESITTHVDRGRRCKTIASCDDLLAWPQEPRRIDDDVLGGCDVDDADGARRFAETAAACAGAAKRPAGNFDYPPADAASEMTFAASQRRHDLASREPRGDDRARNSLAVKLRASPALAFAQEAAACKRRLRHAFRRYQGKGPGAATTVGGRGGGAGGSGGGDQADAIRRVDVPRVLCDLAVRATPLELEVLCYDAARRSQSDDDDDSVATGAVVAVLAALVASH